MRASTGAVMIAIIVIAGIVILAVVIAAVIIVIKVSKRNRPATTGQQQAPNTGVGVARIVEIKETPHTSGSTAIDSGEPTLGRFTLTVTGEDGRQFLAQAEKYVHFHAQSKVRDIAAADGRPGAEYSVGALVPVKFQLAAAQHGTPANPTQVWIIDPNDPEAQRVLHSLRSRGLV